MPPPAPAGSLLRPDLRIFQVFGANTDVGKTIWTTILCRASNCDTETTTWYLKPVSTGPANAADAKYERSFQTTRKIHLRTYAPGVVSETLFQYDLAVSPHLAARVSNRPTPSDQALIRSVRDFAMGCIPSGSGWLFIETAGGVHSPGPAGSTQADLYMPLRLPVILIGDHKLGGISLSISAFESLRMRGYDIVAVLLFEGEEYKNHEYLTDYFRRHHAVHLGVIPSPPLMDSGPQAMEHYYQEVSSQKQVAAVVTLLREYHDNRIRRLREMAVISCEKIWFPFTQHGTLLSEDVTVIDSAYEDHFQTLATQSNPALQAQGVLRPTFDGSASWWTQGLGHGNPKLALAAAYAASRYGHVTFAQAVHEPALTLAEMLLDGLQNPRLTRVFFSDNGSTGVEVAVKMALRATCNRYGWGTSKDVEVLGLRGSYHGDTIGAMDCSEPNTFNEKVEWYSGRGLWLEYPTVQCANGQWVVELPPIMAPGGTKSIEFRSLSEIFNVKRRKGQLQELYVRYILDTLGHSNNLTRKFGALLLEPIVLGAGGMALVDPLFQRTLVEVVRQRGVLFSNSEPTGYPPNEPRDKNDWCGLPVIFDEVFTGLYRLGHFSAASFLGVHPDISVHAKLLTGGLLPLAVTVASEGIFKEFDGVDKSDALLHGHSYTAHPVGCQVALESVRTMRKMESERKWDWASGQDNGWAEDLDGQADFKDHNGSAKCPHVWSVWSAEFVKWLSKQKSTPSKRVKGAWALGSILAIHLDPDQGTVGYESNAAAGIKNALLQANGLEDGIAWNVHSRALGNVFYVMASQVTSKESIDRLEFLMRSFFSGN